MALIIMGHADRVKLFGLEGRASEIRALAPVVAQSVPAAIQQFLALHRQDARFEPHLRRVDEGGYASLAAPHPRRLRGRL